VDKQVTEENWEDYDKWMLENCLVGSATESVLVQGDFWRPDEELRNKYPALQKAWEKYLVIKNLCVAKENETR
tara:strand:- start:445 stop:663 length:219 start_codon:yes stop_codon:yes gene_type:complete